MLSKRLDSLVKYFNKSDNVVDIGCDHAYLSIYLIKNKLINKAIVSDISESAIKNAKENIKLSKVDIDARCGSGLSVLNESDKINTILISGMGTNTILEILNTDLTDYQKLIIQSNNDHDKLRSEICALGYKIIAEDFFEDAKIHYINIIFTKGECKYKKCELKYGPFLIHNKEYLNFELNKLIKIANLIPKTKLKYLISLKRDIKELKKLLKKS